MCAARITVAEDSDNIESVNTFLAKVKYRILRIIDNC